jgi:hypothetical protein
MRKITSALFTLSLLTLGCFEPVDTKDAGATIKDAGLASDAGLSGTWTLTGTYGLGGGNPRIRSFHTVTATETGSEIVFNVGTWCQLKATKTATAITLNSGQKCTVPMGATFELAAENSPSVFGMRGPFMAPYCYGVALTSAASVAPSNNMSFSGTGFANSNECTDPIRALTFLQIDLSR